MMRTTTLATSTFIEAGTEAATGKRLKLSESGYVNRLSLAHHSSATAYPRKDCLHNTRSKYAVVYAAPIKRANSPRSDTSFSLSPLHGNVVLQRLHGLDVLPLVVAHLRHAEDDINKHHQSEERGRGEGRGGGAGMSIG